MVTSQSGEGHTNLALCAKCGKQVRIIDPHCWNCRSTEFRNNPANSSDRALGFPADSSKQSKRIADSQDSRGLATRDRVTRLRCAIVSGWCGRRGHRVIRRFSHACGSIL